MVNSHKHRTIGRGRKERGEEEEGSASSPSVEQAQASASLVELTFLATMSSDAIGEGEEGAAAMMVELRRERARRRGC